jgi:HAMP domain-containing protein
MTAKEFLRQARDADRRIDEAMERLERMRAKLEAGRMSNLTGMPRGGALDWTETADRVIELEKRVNSRIREMVRQKQAAMDAIDRVEEARLREVLELYYLDGYTWEQVAEQMDLSDRHVKRMHGIALLRVKVPKEEGETWENTNTHT